MNVQLRDPAGSPHALTAITPSVLSGSIYSIMTTFSSFGRDQSGVYTCNVTFNSPSPPNSFLSDMQPFTVWNTQSHHWWGYHHNVHMHCSTYARTHTRTHACTHACTHINWGERDARLSASYFDTSIYLSMTLFHHQSALWSSIILIKGVLANLKGNNLFFYKTNFGC